MYEILTTVVDEKFDIRLRLAQLCEWRDEWLCEDERLKARLRQLNPKVTRSVFCENASR